MVHTSYTKGDHIMTEESKKSEMSAKDLTPMEDEGLEQMAGGARGRIAELCRFCGRRFALDELITHERTCPKNPDQDVSPVIH